MIVPVTGTIPDSTLLPLQVRQKFSSQTLAGLGDTYCSDGFMCSEIADDGTCVGCIPDPSYVPATSTLPGGTTAPPDSAFSYGDYTPSFSGAGITPSTASGVSVVSSSVDAQGNIYMALSNGKYVYMSPSGQVLAGVGAPTATGGTVTGQQASAWPALINALTQAGVKLGTVALLPAGSTLLPNGTIVGSGQSLVSGSGSINSSISGILSNPMVLIGGFGILVLLVLSGGRR